MSTGAVYTYFLNKEAMVRAILEHARKDRRERLNSAMQRDAAGPAFVLLEWVREIFGQQGRHRARIDVHLWAEALRTGSMRKLAQHALKEATGTLSGVLAGRMANVKRARSLDPAAAASVLVALYLGLEVQRAVGVRLDSDEVVRVLSALFADYLPGPETPDDSP